MLETKISKLIMFSHNCVVRRNYFTEINNFLLMVFDKFFLVLIKYLFILNCRHVSSFRDSSVQSVVSSMLCIFTIQGYRNKCKNSRWQVLINFRKNKFQICYVPIYLSYLPYISHCHINFLWEYFKNIIERTNLIHHAWRTEK